MAHWSTFKWLVATLCGTHFVLVLVHAEFTLPTDGGGSFPVGVIQQNHSGSGTWCFYPVAGFTRSATCGGNTAFVFQVHLNQSTSIGYYYPDGSRPGGAEWPIPPTNPGLIFLCASGRAGDGTYLTFCAWPATVDNNIPNAGSNCAAAIAQDTVTDGCYTPNQLPYTTSFLPYGTGTSNNSTATGPYATATDPYATITEYIPQYNGPVSRQHVGLFTIVILVIFLILGQAAFSLIF